MQHLFLTISLLSLLFLYFGTGRDKRLLLIIFSWQIVVGVLAFLNVFEKQPILFPVLILGTFIITFISLKRIDKQKLNLNILLAIHILRIPVELMLFELFLQKQIPVLMTFKGWNFDILIGFSALAILIYKLLSKRKINRTLIFIWNTIGLAFLFIIVSLAILSSPLPIQQFAFDQPNIAVLTLPFCFLPTCVVPIVLMSHILLYNWRE